MGDLGGGLAHGWSGTDPRARVARVAGQGGFPPGPSRSRIVAGNMIRLEAKIAGITPAMFSFSGRCELWFM